MAPKTERSRSGASSSSQAQPNLSGIFHNCFNDPNTDIDLFTQFQNFKSFPIRRDRVVDFEFLSSTQFNFRYMQKLRDWKFITLLKIKPQVFGTLVRVFYSNARLILNGEETETIVIESYVMGKPIVLDTQTIATHLGLQSTGLSEESTTFPNLYPPGTSTSVLHAHDRFLHLMVSNNIRINLAQIIFTDMVYTINHRHTNLVKSFPYGTVLSHIFLKEEIHCSMDLALPLTELIDEKSLRKCKFHLVNNEWVRNPNQDDDGDDVAPPQAPPVVAAPPPVDIQALFATLNANLDARFTAIDARFTAIDARFTTFTEDVNARFNSLDARHNAMETRFKAQEDALRRVQTDVSAHHLEGSSHTFGGIGLNDHTDEEEEDTILHAYHLYIDTLSCRSAFNAGRKLPNGSIDDLTYQNGWKSVRGYKNKLLKLQQQQEQHPRAKIKFKSSFVLYCQTLVTQSVIFIPIHCLGCVSSIWAKLYHL
ncbi:hypothetical protein GQ457_06G012570 [Hibiscus cannabinus]